jgi:hypothetical protein
VTAAQQAAFVPTCTGNAAADTTAFQSIVKGAAGAQLTIQVPFKSDPTTLCKLNSISFESNITLDFTQGAIQVVTGQTVTARAPIIAPPARKIFYNALGGQGTVVLRGPVYPDWWAANSTPGTTDMSRAIDAADAAICSGALAPDGVTIVAQGLVKFATANYRLDSGLIYRGAPWAGEGPNNTLLDYRGSGVAIDAVGSNAARRQLNISNLTLTGANSRAGAYGLRLGWNMRSFQALNHVNVEHFPLRGILFAQDEWQLSFYDLAVIACASTSGSGIEIDPAVTTVNQLNWFDLQLENNGQARSTRAGGVDSNTSALHQWDFFGGIFQGNKGIAEGRFVGGANVGFFGTYVESGLASSGAVDGLIFGGGITACLVNVNFYADAGHGGTAFRCLSESNCSLNNIRIHSNWPTAIAAEGGAIVQVLSLGSLVPGVTVVNETSSAAIRWPPGSSPTTRSP